MISGGLTWIASSVYEIYGFVLLRFLLQHGSILDPFKPKERPLISIKNIKLGNNLRRLWPFDVLLLRLYVDRRLILNIGFIARIPLKPTPPLRPRLPLLVPRTSLVPQPRGLLFWPYAVPEVPLRLRVLGEVHVPGWCGAFVEEEEVGDEWNVKSSRTAVVYVLQEKLV